MDAPEDPDRTAAGLPAALLFPQFPRPRCRVALVSGPPGGGKSSHVAQHRAPGDLVIDLDDIKSELSGLPIYQAGPAWSVPALQARNERLAALAFEDPDRLAWFVVTAPGGAWHWWRAALRPVRLVPVVPLMRVALERIEADPRRAHDLDRHRSICVRWYEIEIAAAHRRLAQKLRQRRGRDFDESESMQDDNE